MDLALLLRGMLIGLGIAAPVGPIGALCISRTVRAGWRAGCVAGLGAATADACYGASAALGLTLITQLLLDSLGWLQLMGGIYLCYLGVRAMRAAAPAAPIESRSGSALRAFATTFALTITNPLTILSFLAIFGGIGIGTGSDSYNGVPLVLGVFAGSTLWWILLASGVALMRHRLSMGVTHAINIGSGALIFGFGLAALANLVRNPL